MIEYPGKLPKGWGLVRYDNSIGICVGDITQEIAWVGYKVIIKFRGYELDEWHTLVAVIEWCHVQLQEHRRMNTGTVLAADFYVREEQVTWCSCGGYWKPRIELQEKVPGSHRLESVQVGELHYTADGKQIDVEESG